MIKIFKTLVFSLFFFGANLVSAEEIKLFEANIIPYENGSFYVEEKITYDFGTLSRHGIERELLKQHPQPASAWYKKRSLEITPQQVLFDGQTATYEVTESTNSIKFRIGDPDVEITGVHTYTISYVVKGGLSYYDTGITELYWNVTGSNWSVPINQVVATVDATNDLLVEQRFCYKGTEGEVDSCKEIRTSTSSVSFIATLLAPGMGLTIAQELDATQVQKTIVEKTPAWALWFVGVISWLGIIGWFVYRYKNEYNPRESIVSQYEPFEDFKPMFTGVLIDGRLDAKDITAGLLYLAQKGFISIKKTNAKVLLFFEVDDYEVTLLRDVDEVETKFLKDVLLLLFAQVDAIGKVTKLSELKTDTTKQKENQRLVESLRTAVMDDLVERQYFERIMTLPVVVIIAVVAMFFLMFLFPVLFVYLGSMTLPLLIVVFGTIIIVGFAYQRRTRKGYVALNHLKGFKEFLSVTETERYAFHNAPEKSPQQFMEYLPYAVAFGVEKQWAEVFKDIQISNPNWYQSTDGKAFSAIALTSDLSAFSNSFTQTTSTTSGSGSSGGGFSGGGSGGGGGGSW